MTESADLNENKNMNNDIIITDPKTICIDYTKCSRKPHIFMALEISDFDTAIHTNFYIETDRGR